MRKILGKQGFALPLVLVVVVVGIVVGVVGLQLFLKNKVGPPYMPGISIDETKIPQATVPVQKDETANWKIYTNTNYRTSFKYPADAVESANTLYSMLSRSSSTGLNVAPAYQEPYSKWYTFDLVVRDNSQNVDAKTIINNYADDIRKNCTPPACSTPKLITDTLKPYKNGNIDGYIFHIGAETDSAMVVQVRNNKTYIFRMSGEGGNVTDYGLKIFDQILSTFRFE